MKSELLQQALHSNPTLQRLNSVTDSVFTGSKLPGLSSTHRQKAASAAQTACVKIMEGRGAHTSSGHRHSGQMAADHLWQPQCRRVEAVIAPDCCLWCQTHMLTCHIWLDCRDVSSVMFNKILFLHTLGHEDVPKSTFGQKNKQFYYQLNYSVLSPQPLIYTTSIWSQLMNVIAPFLNKYLCILHTDNYRCDCPSNSEHFICPLVAI